MLIIVNPRLSIVNPGLMMMVMVIMMVLVMVSITITKPHQHHHDQQADHGHTKKQEKGQIPLGLLFALLVPGCSFAGAFVVSLFLACCSPHTDTETGGHNRRREQEERTGGDNRRREQEETTGGESRPENEQKKGPTEEHPAATKEN